MNDLFSIVMPAYNSEEYIRQAIDSVLRQGYEKWELIVVDDGSVDGTARICDEYADDDSRIRVIHQQNSGTLKAIQKGFSESKGSYVCPIASDDWIDEDFLQYLEDQINSYNDIDIICYEYYSHAPGMWNSEGIKCSTIEDYFGIDDRKTVSSDVFLDFVLRTTFFGEIKCINRSVISYSEYELGCFEHKNTFFNSDVYQMIPVICNSRNILLTCRGLYHYRLRDNSISHSNDNTERQIGCILDCMEYIFKTLTQRGWFNDLRRKMILTEALRELDDKMKRVIKRPRIIRDYGKIKSHFFYLEMKKSMGNKELVGACVAAGLPLFSTVASFKLFNTIVAVRS